MYVIYVLFFNNTNLKGNSTHDTNKNHHLSEIQMTQIFKHYWKIKYLLIRAASNRCFRLLDGVRASVQSVYTLVDTAKLPITQLTDLVELLHISGRVDLMQCDLLKTIVTHNYLLKISTIGINMLLLLICWIKVKKEKENVILIIIDTRAFSKAHRNV